MPTAQPLMPGQVQKMLNTAQAPDGKQGKLHLVNVSSGNIEILTRDVQKKLNEYQKQAEDTITRSLRDCGISQDRINNNGEAIQHYLAKTSAYTELPGGYEMAIAGLSRCLDNSEAGSQAREAMISQPQHHEKTLVLLAKQWEAARTLLDTLEASDTRAYQAIHDAKENVDNALAQLNSLAEAAADDTETFNRACAAMAAVVADLQASDQNYRLLKDMLATAKNGIENNADGADMLVKMRGALNYVKGGILKNDKRNYNFFGHLGAVTDVEFYVYPGGKFGCGLVAVGKGSNGEFVASSTNGVPASGKVAALLAFASRNSHRKGSKIVLRGTTVASVATAFWLDILKSYQPEGKTPDGDPHQNHLRTVPIDTSNIRMINKEMSAHDVTSNTGFLGRYGLSARADSIRKTVFTPELVRAMRQSPEAIKEILNTFHVYANSFPSRAKKFLAQAANLQEKLSQALQENDRLRQEIDALEQKSAEAKSDVQPDRLAELKSARDNSQKSIGQLMQNPLVEQAFNDLQQGARVCNGQYELANCPATRQLLAREAVATSGKMQNVEELYNKPGQHAARVRGGVNTPPHADDGRSDDNSVSSVGTPPHADDGRSDDDLTGGDRRVTAASTSGGNLNESPQSLTSPSVHSSRSPSPSPSNRR